MEPVDVNTVSNRSESVLVCKLASGLRLKLSFLQENKIMMARTMHTGQVELRFINQMYWIPAEAVLPDLFICMCKAGNTDAGSRIFQYGSSQSFYAGPGGDYIVYQQYVFSCQCVRF